MTMPTRILIGAPVYKRQWILPDWFDNIAHQYGNYDLGFVFALESEDTESKEVIQERVQDFDPWIYKILEAEPGGEEHPGEKRHWNQLKYKRMANIRNALLETARETEPDRYFSLDSDILLEDRETMKSLVKATARGALADAANPLMFMTPTSNVAPSFMTWNKFKSMRAHRADIGIGKPKVVDVIMAAKMMNKKAYYRINYYAHPQGEDVGWSDNCRNNDVTLACLANIYAPHIMSPEMLETYKNEGDPRRRYLKSV